MKNQILKSCVLICALIPSLTYAHSGHGNTTVSQFLHDVLYHSVYEWHVIIFSLISIGCVLLFNKCLLGNKIIKRFNLFDNDRRCRKS